MDTGVQANLFGTKRCPRCGEVKALGEFHRNKKARDGRQTACKICRNVAERARPNANPGKKRTRNAAYRKANLEKERARDAARYKANPEKKLARDAVRSKANPEKRRAKDAVWRKANPDSVRAMHHRRRARKRNADGSWTAFDIEFLMLKQRGKCAHSWCREPLKKKFHRDHIIPLAIGGTNDRRNMQLLCATCNFTKGAKHPIDFAQRHGMLL
jgi:hypothetical protein